MSFVGIVAYIFTQSMSLLYAIVHPSRIHNLKFFRPSNDEGKPEFLLVAAEDKKVTVYELQSTLDTPPRVVAELVGHTNRRVVLLHYTAAHLTHVFPQSEGY